MRELLQGDAQWYRCRKRRSTQVNQDVSATLTYENHVKVIFLEVVEADLPWPFLAQATEGAGQVLVGHYVSFEA